MTFIKQEQQEIEQEDLIMSYLNADYLSTDELPLSPPNSTSSSSDTQGSPAEKNTVDDFMLDINSFSTENWNTQHLFNPCVPHEEGVLGLDLLDAFPFFLQQQQVPLLQQQPVVPLQSSASSTCSSLSDTEQPKKKRGRKKREPAPVQNMVTALPKPLAPRPITSSTTSINTSTRPDIVIKSEPSTLPLAGPMLADTNTKSTEQMDQKQAQIQKRQERLIKNRAAALLSRKRKREHLSCLEDEKQQLEQENEQLHTKVNQLEERIQSLEQENLDLKQRLQVSPPNISIGQHKRPLITSTTKSNKTTGVVFMIILFSFALFTLPSRTADRLTVGGSSVLDKKQFPLIGSSDYNVDYSVEQYCQTDECKQDHQANTTDLVLIDAVRPRDLQTWINHKQESKKEEPTRHVYLYSKEFSQIAPIHATDTLSNEFTTDKLPILSLISPYNQTVVPKEQQKEDDEEQYLQIDVQVLRSTVIRSQLLPLQQCDTADALLLGMKKDLIINQPQRTVNVTPPIIVKREKRAASKKLARVIV